MNINSAEASLAKYHLLHFVIGAILATILLAIPKLFGVMITVFLVAIFMPDVVLPEFGGKKWYSTLAVLAGAVIVAIVFHLLKRL
jgi:hypothetical protein